MKYEKEYVEADGVKEKFVLLMKERYPNLDSSTPSKRFYDIRKRYGKGNKKKKRIKKEAVIVPIESDRSDELQVVIEPTEKKEPNHFKRLLIDDIKQFGKKLSRNYMRQYGFSEEEINWVLENEKNNESE